MNPFAKLKRFIAINFNLHRDPTKRIISFWEKGGPDFEYFNSADQEAWLKVFWKEDSRFYELFQHLLLDFTLEIACGTGRHSAMVIDKIKHLYLLDSSAGALEIAKQKFSKFTKVTFVHNKSGYGIPSNVADESLTAIFSYDAMVHFEKEAVFSYVKDSFRKLKPGCFGLFHHSNYSLNPNGKFTDNPGWRNFMNRELFISFAQECGFEVIQSEIISFSCKDSDCITLVKKPSKLQ